MSLNGCFLFRFQFSGIFAGCVLALRWSLDKPFSMSEPPAEYKGFLSKNPGMGKEQMWFFTLWRWSWWRNHLKNEKREILVSFSETSSDPQHESPPSPASNGKRFLFVTFLLLCFFWLLGLSLSSWTWISFADVWPIWTVYHWLVQSQLFYLQSKVSLLSSTVGSQWKPVIVNGQPPRCRVQWPVNSMFRLFWKAHVCLSAFLHVWICWFPPLLQLLICNNLEQSIAKLRLFQCVQVIFLNTK